MAVVIGAPSWSHHRHSATPKHAAATRNAGSAA
jgi:hypothetical protein